MNRKNDMSERFGKCRFFDRTEPAFAAVRKLHKKRFDLSEFTIKSETSEEMVLVRLNHLRRVLQHSSVVEPNRFVSLGIRVVRLQLKKNTTDTAWRNVFLPSSVPFIAAFPTLIRGSTRAVASNCNTRMYSR
jgi:hypothetical protein